MGSFKWLSISLFIFFSFGLIEIIQAQEVEPLDVSLVDVLWSQPVDTPSFMSFYTFHNTHNKTSSFLADNFELKKPARIEIITAYGYTNSVIPMKELASTLSIKIFRDNNGKPLGHPIEEPGRYIFSLEIPTENNWLKMVECLETGESIVEVHLNQLEDPLELEPGTYWLTLYFDTRYIEYSWFWRFSAPRSFSAHIIDPYDSFLLNAREWVPFSSFGWPYYNVAFKLEGVIYD